MSRRVASLKINKEFAAEKNKFLNSSVTNGAVFLERAYNGRVCATGRCLFGWQLSVHKAQGKSAVAICAPLR